MLRFSSFQQSIRLWMIMVFPEHVIKNKQERAMRFFEESLELCQSIGMTKEQALKLVDYTYSRPEGEPFNEVGGVMVTLAALCETSFVRLDEAAEAEFHRISQPEMMEKIRNKQVTKDLMGITPKDLYDKQESDENDRS